MLNKQGPQPRYSFNEFYLLEREFQKVATGVYLSLQPVFDVTQSFFRINEVILWVHTRNKGKSEREFSTPRDEPVPIETFYSGKNP